MYFLGQAGGFRAKDIVRHLFAFGTAKDSRKLREHLAKRYGVSSDRVVLYHTGRTALAAALQATVQGEGDILVTALTCYAVVEAVRAAGFNPVFADVTPENLHFDGKTLKDALRKHPQIKAIVVQNNLGYPCKIAEIEKIVKQHHLPLIEDLAHCAGVRYEDGREAGTVGSAAILSFGKGKSIDTTSGGALVLRDKQPLPPAPTKKPGFSSHFRDRFYPLFGAMIRGFYHLGLGRYFTSLLLKLHFIERSADAELNFSHRPTFWQDKLALRQLEQLPNSRPPLREFYFVRDRDKVLKELEKAGFVMFDTWYDTPVAPERYFAKSGFLEKECPVATDLATKLVNLPTYYKHSDLEPARRIIAKYEVKGEK